MLLVELLAFGAASQHVGSPPGAEVVVVADGAGPDGEVLATVDDPAGGDRLTIVLTNGGDDGRPVAITLWERDPSGTFAVPEPPSPGRGAVRLLAVNTAPSERTLRATVGGRSFYVGDGSGVCLVQRRESAGFEPDLLGGNQLVDVELPSGTTRITLHRWPSIDACVQPATFAFDVDVVADATRLVLVYTPDGPSLATLDLPFG